jgi:23S rRNA pseudouridine2604 synthase
MNSSSTIRLNKYISEKGICSRREADRHIEAGRVFLNGVKATLGSQVKPGDRVMVNGIKLDQVEEKQLIILALNKPVGIVSTTERTTKGNIVDYVNHSERIFPIGRLDKDSQGLILLTNNGDIVNKILRAGNNHEKEYLVTVDNPITEEFISGMANGVPIMGEVTRKCKVTKESGFVFRIILVQGKNRQIRRMCEYFGFGVMKLERIRIMNITLKGLPLGDWRELDEDEIVGIMQSIENSTSEPKRASTASKPQRVRTDKDYHSKENEYGSSKVTKGRDTDKSKSARGKSAGDKSGRGNRNEDKSPVKGGFSTRKSSPRGGQKQNGGRSPGRK